MHKEYPCFRLFKNMQILNIDFHVDAYYSI